VDSNVTSERKNSRRRKRTRGQALVEFALVIPIFLLILSGILDFGNMLYSRMSVINATREGARAAVTAADATTIPSVASGAARNSASGISGASLVISTNCIAIKTSGSCSWASKSASQPGDAVSVTVTYSYHSFFPLLFGATIPMSSTVQMVIE
jgi:Flp pilus assembly protein TadG